MSNHLEYYSEVLPKRNLFIQLVSEIKYSLFSLLYLLKELVFKQKDFKEGSKRPIVFVSGLGGNKGYFKHLQNEFIEKDYSIYNARLGFQFGSLEKSADKLERYFEKHNLNQVYVISFGLGGLIPIFLNYKGRDKIKKVISVGTPFQGTWIAYFLFFIPAYWSIFIGSATLKKLQNHYNSFLNIQAIYSKFDLSILPRNNAKLNRFDDILIDEVGHLNLISDKLAVECIIELIENEEKKG